jgi:predicted permease
MSVIGFFAGWFFLPASMVSFMYSGGLDGLFFVSWLYLIPFYIGSIIVGDWIRKNLL